MEMLSSKQKIVIIIAGIIVVGIFIFYMSTKTKAYSYSEINEEIDQEMKEDDKEIEEEKVKEIVIHITGAVQNEGIVKLEESSRVADAIEKAGGLTSEADLVNVNLAYQLKDGQKIYIPKISDTEEEIIMSPEREETIIIDKGPNENLSTSINSKTNINTANTSQLMNLSGVGAATANKIIEYRNVNGKFKTIEDIKNVSGIGEAKFENIKNDICVE